MKKNHCFIPAAVILLLTGVWQLSSAQTADELGLFNYEQPAMARQTLPAHQLDRHYLNLNPSVTDQGFLQPGDRIAFMVDDQPESFDITRVKSYTEGTYSVIARGNRSVGDNLVLTFEGERMIGELNLSGAGRHYHFRYDGDMELNYLSAVDVAGLDIQGCAVNESLLTDPRRESSRAATESAAPAKTHGPAVEMPYGSKPNLSALSDLSGQELTIDLMVVYTEAAETWAADHPDLGSIAAVIAQSIAMSQEALDNSDVHILLRLVHTHKTDYDESDEDATAGTHLRRFAESPHAEIFGTRDYEGFMEEIHDLRDEYGADLAALFADEPGTGGIAFQLNNSAGSPDFGFSINRVQQMANSYTLIHEIGHNLGNAHARDQNSSPAGKVGGLYEYSTGYRWQNSNGDFTTVMGYAEGPYRHVPLFSNPEIMWEGSPAGIHADGDDPSDNARSMREIKRIVAGYRPTIVDPPLISAPSGPVTVSMDRESQHQVSITITNEGDSDLIWDADFYPLAPMQSKNRHSGAHSGTVGEMITASIVTNDHPGTVRHAAGTAFSAGISGDPSRKNNSGDIAGISDAADFSGQHSRIADPPEGRLTGGSGSVFKTADVDRPVLFSTRFDAVEGFETGITPVARRWRTSTDNIRFEISSDNPSEGSQHLRLIHNEELDGSVFVTSPYFGPQPVGHYVFSADISLENLNNDRLDLYLRDENTGGYSAGVMFVDGDIYFMFLNEQGSVSLGTFRTKYATEGYGTIRIELDPVRPGILYYYNDQMFADTDYISGRSVDYFNLILNNESTDATADIDNIEILRPYDPFKWLNVKEYGGIIPSGSSADLELEFTTRDVPAGHYKADLILRSNDPEHSSVIIPLELEVSGVVSVENKPETPAQVTLSQNYPNPFNPVTVIEFALPEQAAVRLEVFDMLGRRAATLIDEQMPAGNHQARLNAANLAGGMYIYRLTAGNRILSRKMILMK